MREAAGMLTFDHRNKSFGKDADGYVRGEGAAAIVLQRSDLRSYLKETEEDDDCCNQPPPQIYAKVLSSAVNQDGRSASFTAPNGISQQELLRNALSHSAILPHQVDYLEAHGTGTSLGDPVEFGAIQEVLLARKNGSSVTVENEQPLIIGAVKSNIGHLEGAAGLAGILKAVLSLKNGQVPRSLHNEALNPLIDLHEEGYRPVLFPQQAVPLKKDAIVGVISCLFHINVRHTCATNKRRC